MRTALTVSISIAILLAAAACGGGDSEPAIRTQKGLGVGLVAMAAGDNGESGGQQPGGGASLPTSAPVPGYGGDRADTGGEKGGFYPGAPLQQGQTGVTVYGYGYASADADSAILELYFGAYSTKPVYPETPTETDGGGADAGSAQDVRTGPITEADLQAVIDAIAGEGVARDDIEFIGNPYYDAYTTNATLRATVKDLGKLDDIVQATTNAATGLPEISLQSTTVSYTLGDCAALEKAALEAAAGDAGERASVFADALGVGLGPIAGASSYSYSPYGGTTCDAGAIGPYPLGGYAYTQGQAHSVQLFASVTITYGIE